MSSTPRNQTAHALWFLGPWLVGFAALIVYPFAASLWWSFCRYDLLSPPEFIGWDNYRRLLSEVRSGEAFGLALSNTIYYALVSVPLSVALGVMLAVMLSWQVRGRAVLRTIFFLPSVIPVVAASILWMWLLDPQDGLVNYLLGYVGISPQGWFTLPRAIFSPADWRAGAAGLGSKDGLVLMSLWGVGNFMIIYLAALGDVPRQLYEAAELDGAGAARKFIHVTIPMLSPVILFNLVMGLIQAVQAFTQIYIVSEGQGAPAGASLVISLHLLLSAFKNYDMGYASAVAWVLFVIILVVTAVLMRWSRRWVHYQGAVA